MLAQAGRPVVAGHAREALAAIVVKQLGPAPAIEEQIVEAVVVVVAPDRAHRHAVLALIEIGHAEPLGDVFERAVAPVAEQPVPRPFFAVGDVEVGQAVAVDVDDRDRGAHRGDLRHDVRQLGVERRRLVHELEPRGLRRFGQAEAVLRQRVGMARGRQHARLRPEPPHQERRQQQSQRTRPRARAGRNASSDHLTRG